MKYKGIELTEFKSDKNVAFDPIKKMLVWDSDGHIYQYPVLLYAGGIKDHWKVIAIDPNDGTIVRFAYCAEIPKPKTNWDLFQERYSVFKLPLKNGIEVFNEHGIPCGFCPARTRCTSAEHSDSCKETFKSWAEMEADEAYDLNG